jgi:predicted RNA binding protein YcfA (HicA-like mRNA interferase family)
VAKYEALLARILSGTADAGIGFNELCRLLARLGFEERIRGGHHIFTKDDVEEILNLQPKGRNAKPYQVKQVRTLIVKYRLAGGTNAE